MELRHLRYFVAVGEEQHYGRAAARLRLAQPALTRQIQDLEEEIGFQLFDRLPRGVRLSSGGKSFLEDARRILQQVDEARMRASQVARGQSGTLRVGFVESVSWHGAVPDSFREFRRKQPNAELQLNPLSSQGQLESVLSGRIDAGFAHFVAKGDRVLAKLQVTVNRLVLAMPTAHPFAKLTALRLRDLKEANFIFFPRRLSAAFYDQIMRECFKGGLIAPNIVQEGVDEATILSLVSCGLGVAFVNEAVRWRCPKGVALLPVTDLNVAIPLTLIWKRDNVSPLLANFVTLVRQMPGVVQV